MPALVGVGKLGLTKVFTAVVNPGTLLTFPVPVKSFLIKPVGGTVFLKFNATDSDSDGFILGDGEAIQLDLSSRFPASVNTSTVGIVYTTAGTVQVYTIVGC